MQDEILINKVANSGLLTIDLEQFYPTDEFVNFDLKPYLFMELILKEKDFRESLKNTDWSIYQNKHVCIICSADAIIPVWAYMLVTANLQPVAKHIFNGSIENAITQSILTQLKNQLVIEEYTDQRVVIKGCGEKQISEAVYVAATAMLLPVVKSIMYGEPCSTVPIFKKRV
jgi:Protein of unknown function (DUF2480)